MPTCDRHSCLVSVGSTRNDFRRLIEAVDHLCEHGRLGATFAQIGSSSYVPRYCSFERYVGREELAYHMERAELIICHAGTGTLNAALGLGKRIIVVPRRAELHEHPDNHQLELASFLSSRGRALCVDDIQELESVVANAWGWTPTFPESDSNGVIALIEEFACQHL